MINTKEYNEILAIFKDMIFNNEIQITSDSFSISYIKSILLSNQRFQSEISALKEKFNYQNEKNKNILGIIQTLNKKKSKDQKILLNSLDVNFNLFYNEPYYINDLNTKLYQNIIQDIQKKSISHKMISIINGNFSEELFKIKEEYFNNDNFANFNPQYILETIYSVRSPNINWEELSPSPFKFKLNSFNLSYLKETFGSMIVNWNNLSEEQMNNKKKRDSMTRLIQEGKYIQLLELCKSGIPNCIRKNVYMTLLNIKDSQNIDTNQNDSILIYDYYILRDANRITASENYFLFKENLIRLLCFLIRDADLLTQIQGIRPILTLKINNKTLKGDIYLPFPQCGIFPFQGFAFQLAPFTYMSINVNDYYSIAKMFYAKFLSFTSSYTTERNSILTLLCSFNYIFNECDLLGDVKKHFDNIGFDVNSIAIYWFMTSFATIMSPENVFRIYDLIIITNSMSIFILFGLAIIYYKREELVKITDNVKIMQTFADICYEQIDCLELLTAFINAINEV